MLLFTHSSTTLFENTTSFATEQQFSWSGWQCTRNAVEARYKRQRTKKRQESALNAATALWDRCVNAVKWRTTRPNNVDAQWERNYREAVTSHSNSYCAMFIGVLHHLYGRRGVVMRTQLRCDMVKSRDPDLLL